MNPTPKGTLLIVDDEAANLGVLFEFLRQSGYRVLVAEDAASALEIVALTLPDLVLLDVHLPDMDGFELCASLRGNTRTADLPVIFLTIASETQDKLRGFDLQAVDYITKPFSPAEVVARVEQHLQLRALQRRLQEQNIRLQAEIGERVRVEQELARQRAYLDSIMRSADDRAIITTDLDLRVTYFNPRAAAIYRLPASATLGRHIQEVCSETLPRERVAQGLDAVHSTGEHRYVMALEIDGSLRHFSSRLSAIHNAEGAAVGYARFTEEITARVLAEEELKQHRDNLEVMVEERTRHMRDLAARLADAEQTERHQLARELHDQVGQNLTALSLNLKALQGQIAVLPDPGDALATGSRLDDSLAMVKETTQRIRNVMDNLRPPALEEFGLLAALRWYASQFSARAGLAVDVRGGEPSPRLSPTVEIALFRIAQEALTNVARHAQASHVLVLLENENSRIRLVISDDGVGFLRQPSPTPGKEQRWGLLTMAERAQALHGHCRVESQPGAGTQVIVEVER